MEVTLNRLKDKIARLGCRAFFNPPATEDEIRDVEEKLKIVFPASVRKFYLTFNGGFFADTSWSEKDLNDSKHFETIQWNSNYIMSLQDIKAGFGNRYPDCVPIVHTHTQEFLAIVNPLKDGESPIYDAFHEYPPSEWGVLYENFEDLLNDYINKEGEIKTMAV
jgi:hypothetical protein